MKFISQIRGVRKFEEMCSNFPILYRAAMKLIDDLELSPCY